MKKLVLVLIISILSINASKNKIILNQIPYIYCLICFLKSSKNFEALIGLINKFNIITSTYTLKSDLQI